MGQEGAKSGQEGPQFSFLHLPYQLASSRPSSPCFRKALTNMTFQAATPFAGPSVLLVQSAKQMQKKLEAYGVYPKHKAFPRWEEMQGAAGMTWGLTVDGMPVWVIGIGKDADPIEVVSTLAHEAVHVKQGWMEYISESEPSAEFEAYVVQAIMRIVLRQYKVPVKGKASL